MTKPNVQSRLTILLLTLLLLIAPFCLGYLFYVTSQRSYFTRRNFRVLDSVGTQIRLKVDNLSTSFINATNKAKAEKNRAETRARRQPALNLEVLRRAVSQVNKYGPNLKLDSTVPVSQTAPTRQSTTPVPPRDEQTAKPPAPRASVQATSEAPKSAEPSSTQSASAPAVNPEPVVNMEVRPEKGAFALVLEYRSSGTDSRPTSRIPGHQRY